ncbi:MAG TPA: serine hydrolase domain-containing protein [Frankiaceae bacterium]|jgi:D-alanyl-D-alanine carboxypeptidase|nr:serine hydrolase domain-containing protein [Frankiaceae bacterium]
MSRLSSVTRFSTRPLTVAAVTSTLLLGAAPLASASAPSAGAQLQQAMNAFVATPGSAPGVAVTIGRGNQFTFLTAGVGNLTTGRKPQANDQMRMASVAKAFSGAAALSLVSRGKLKLSDTVGKVIPKMPVQWKNVTLAELLQHTSGVPDFSLTDAFRVALFKSLQQAPAPRVLLSYVTNPKLNFTPGSKYEYSNSDNILIGLMIQNATGRSYESVLATNVYGPLNLTRTSLPRGSAMVFPVLRGYDITPPLEDATTLVAAGWSWASGGVVSTPRDALAFVRGYVSGALVNASTRAAQFTFRPGSSEPTGPGTNYAGLGVFKYVTSCGTVYGHTGNTSGYTQFIASSADGSKAVTVSINAQITPKNPNQKYFPALRHIYELAVCAAQ